MVINGAAANVYVVAKLATNSTIGICAKGNANVAAKRKRNNTIGTDASVLIAVKRAMNSTIGSAVSVLVVAKSAMSNTIGAGASVLVAVKRAMNSIIGSAVSVLVVAKNKNTNLWLLTASARKNVLYAEKKEVCIVNTNSSILCAKSVVLIKRLVNTNVITTTFKEFKVGHVIFAVWIPLHNY